MTTVGWYDECQNENNSNRLIRKKTNKFPLLIRAWMTAEEANTGRSNNFDWK